MSIHLMTGTPQACIDHNPPLVVEWRMLLWITLLCILCHDVASTSGAALLMFPLRRGMSTMPIVDVELVSATSQGGASVARIVGVLDTGLSMPLIFPGGGDATSCTVVDALGKGSRVLSACISDDGVGFAHQSAYAAAVRRLRLHASRRKTLHMADGGAVRGILVDAAVAHVSFFLTGVDITTTLDPLSVGANESLSHLHMSHAAPKSRQRRIQLHHMMVVEEVNAAFAVSVLQHLPHACRIVVGCSPVAQHLWSVGSRAGKPRQAIVFTDALRSVQHPDAHGRNVDDCATCCNNATFENVRRFSRLRYPSDCALPFCASNVTAAAPVSKLRYSATVPSLVKVHAARLNRVYVAVPGGGGKQKFPIQIEEAHDISLPVNAVIFDSASPAITIASPALLSAVMERLCSVVVTQCGEPMKTTCTTTGAVDGVMWLPNHQNNRDDATARIRRLQCGCALRATVLVVSLCGAYNGSASIDVQLPLSDLIAVADGADLGAPTVRIMICGGGFAEAPGIASASPVALILGAPLLRSNDVVLSSDGGLGFFEPTVFRAVGSRVEGEMPAMQHNLFGVAPTAASSVVNHAMVWVVVVVACVASTGRRRAMTLAICRRIAHRMRRRC